MTILLGEKRWEDAKELVESNAIVIVPTAAFEQHGNHLPLDTDMRLVTFIAEEVCKRCESLNSPVVITPTIWTGFSPHHMQFEGSITLKMDTFNAVIRDTCESLWHHGFRKIILLNGHGGNANLLKSVVADMTFSLSIRTVTASYWDFALEYINKWRKSNFGGINHGCEMETALMLYLSEKLVHKNLIKDNIWSPASKNISNDIANSGTVLTAFDFSEISEEGVIGEPSKASKERGQELFDYICNEIVNFIEDFEQWDWKEPLKI
ncbi:creatininase family protein [Planococcus beigongshangi]|uniref:creatininase family protein n=1 Tax=Planococcus beigongshangi TaxID=2782536 RepID=UPI00193BFFA7|nr:creatininase family protein [Planococcus beigongshangi]